MDQSHPLGTVAHLWRYPVKALAAEALQAAEIAAEGLSGDRRSALFVESAGHARSGKPFRGKEHNLLHTVQLPEEAIALAEIRAVKLNLRNGGPYFDDSAVSILIDRWLQEAEALTGFALDPLRFRPNLFVRSASGFSASENELIGSRLAAGSVRLRVTDTIKRCVTIGYDVSSGYNDPDVLRVVAGHRANVMGVYCAVERPGSVRVGDLLTRD